MAPLLSAGSKTNTGEYPPGWSVELQQAIGEGDLAEAQEEERSQARIVYLKVFYLKELSLTKKFKFTLV